MSETHKVHPVIRFLDRLIEIPAAIIIMVMMLHVSLNAILRAFFESPIKHTLEVTQYWYLPFIALIGFVAAQRRDQHVSADLIFKRLPRLLQPIISAAGYALAGTISLGFSWYGLQEALHSLEIGRTAGVSELISWPAYFLVPITFLVLTILFYYTSVRSLLTKKNPENYGDAQFDVQDGSYL